MARIYYEQLKPLTHYFPNGNGEAVYNGNMANIYYYEENYDKSLEHYKRVLSIFIDKDDGKNTATTYHNIANVYENLNQLDSAEINYLKAIEIRETKINDSLGLARIYGDYTAILMTYEKMDNAAFNFQKGLDYSENVNCHECVANAYSGLSKFHHKKGQLKETIVYARKAYSLTDDNNLRLQFIESAKQLYEVLKESKKFEEALVVHERYLATKDSISSDEDKEALLRIEMRYEYQKKAQADRIKAADAARIKDAQLAAEQSENKRRQQQTYYLGGGLFLVTLLSLFLFNRFRVKRRQNAIIEAQKIEVDAANAILGEKNKEVLDSINYARRIQSALLLPDRERMNQLLKKYFVLYLPKDIVAGDFYWLEEKDDTVLFAVADCTGHGVPGAMVSVVCHNALNKAVNEFGLTNPGDILEKTREIVLKEFGSKSNEVRDGMDIALYRLKGRELTYSGAYNPLWIIRNGGGEIEEIKADKQPIGHFERSGNFTTHCITLDEGDQIYLFSDGYPDQFGGEKGKKLKTKNFKNLIHSYSSFPVEQQEKMLKEAFFKWSGDFGQIDDVCVFGMKIS